MFVGDRDAPVFPGTLFCLGEKPERLRIMISSVSVDDRNTRTIPRYVGKSERYISRVLCGWTKESHRCGFDSIRA